MVQMVNWPTPGSGYNDTGEGGLYAMLVIPKDTSQGDEADCYIDVAILATRPDAPVSSCGDLWESYDQEESRGKWEAHEFLQGAGKQKLADHVLRSFPQFDMSDELMVAMHIGSTCHSLEGTSGMFAVTFDDLTLAGQNLYVTLKNAYGREPLLWTFLDT
jgi:hypothetical protein